jgi:hypothetical protein
MIGGVVGRVSSPVLERAAAGRPAIVVVAGEAGVGKSRLVGELLRDADGLGAVALTGGCLDVGEGGSGPRADGRGAAPARPRPCP